MSMKETGSKLIGVMDDMKELMVPIISESFVEIADDEEAIKALAISMKSMKIGKEMIEETCEWYDDMEDRIMMMMDVIDRQEAKLNTILDKLDEISHKLDTINE